MKDFSNRLLTDRLLVERYTVPKLKKLIFVNIIIRMGIFFLEMISPTYSMDQDWPGYHHAGQHHFNSFNPVVTRPILYQRTNSGVLPYGETGKCNGYMNNSGYTNRTQKVMKPYYRGEMQRAPYPYQRPLPQYQQPLPQYQWPLPRHNYDYRVSYPERAEYNANNTFSPNLPLPNTMSFNESLLQANPHLSSDFQRNFPMPASYGNDFSYDDAIFPLNTQGGNSFNNFTLEDENSATGRSEPGYSSEEDTTDEDNFQSYRLDQGVVSNTAETLEQVEEYLLNLQLKGVPLSSILLILDLDGTLTEDPDPKSGIKLDYSNVIQRGFSIRIVKELIQKGVKVVVSSAWDDFPATLEKIRLLGLDEALGVDRSQPQKFKRTFENEFGKKECECYCSGRVASVRDLNSPHKYYGNKELSFKIVDPVIDLKEIQHVVFVDDKESNVDKFSRNIKDNMDGLRSDVEVTLFWLY